MGWMCVLQTPHVGCRWHGDLNALLENSAKIMANASSYRVGSIIGWIQWQNSMKSKVHCWEISCWSEEEFKIFFWGPSLTDLFSSRSSNLTLLHKNYVYLVSYKSRFTMHSPARLIPPRGASSNLSTCLEEEDAALFEAPSELLCPITHAVFLDPVLTQAGHVSIASLSNFFQQLPCILPNWNWRLFL